MSAIIPLSSPLPMKRFPLAFKVLLLTLDQAQATLAPSDMRYRTTLEAFRTIYRTEGLRTFYKGLLPSLMGVIHVAVQFPLYEKAKSWAGK